MTPLSTQLEQLESAQLVRRMTDEEQAYMFKHALTQESAYESLLIRKRREIHLYVAQAFEREYVGQLDEYAAILASHYSTAGDDPKTIEYATRAGERAASISAYVEAGLHFANALEVLLRQPDSEENRRARVETSLRQISVAWGTDSTERNLQRLVDAEALARTMPENDRSLLARIHYWIGRVYSYTNDNRLAASYYDRMLAAARESGDTGLIGLACSGAGRTWFIRGYFGKAVPLLQEAIPYLERTDNWPEWVLANSSLAISTAAQGHYLQGRRIGEEALEKAVAIGDLTSIASARGMAARVEFMAGDLERMLKETPLAAKQVEGGNRLVHYMVLGFQAWAEGRLGKPEDARATMQAAKAVAAQLGIRLIFGDWFAAAQAEIELYAGQYEDALRLAREAVDQAQAAGGIFSEGVAQRVWGQALASLNEAETKEAEAHLQESLRLLEEGEALVEAARTRVALGRLRQSRGERVEARADFEQAAEQFRISGLMREMEESIRLIESCAIDSEPSSG